MHTAPSLTAFPTGVPQTQRHMDGTAELRISGGSPGQVAGDKSVRRPGGVWDHADALGDARATLVLQRRASDAPLWMQDVSLVSDCKEREECARAQHVTV